jgi:hypothetical protein
MGLIEGFEEIQDDAGNDQLVMAMDFFLQLVDLACYYFSDMEEQGQQSLH